MRWLYLLLWLLGIFTGLAARSLFDRDCARPMLMYSAPKYTDYTQDDIDFVKRMLKREREDAR